MLINRSHLYPTKFIPRKEKMKLQLSPMHGPSSEEKACNYPDPAIIRKAAILSGENKSLYSKDVNMLTGQSKTFGGLYLTKYFI